MPIFAAGASLVGGLISGNATANASKAQADAQRYAAVISTGLSSSANVVVIGGTTGTAPTSSQLRFTINNGNSGAASDPTYVSVAIFR